MLISYKNDVYYRFSLANLLKLKNIIFVRNKMIASNGAVLSPSQLPSIVFKNEISMKSILLILNMQKIHTKINFKI